MPQKPGPHLHTLLNPPNTGQLLCSPLLDGLGQVVLLGGCPELNWVLVSILWSSPTHSWVVSTDTAPRSLGTCTSYRIRWALQLIQGGCAGKPSIDQDLGHPRLSHQGDAVMLAQTVIIDCGPARQTFA